MIDAAAAQAERTPPVTAVTVGNFDGVHRAHAALVRAARQAASDDGRVIAVSFDPHPATVLRPDAAPARLSVRSLRERLLLEAGADTAEFITPSAEFLKQSPRAFIEWLVGCYRPAAIVEGPDFRFGAGRAGSINTLREVEGEFGYRTVVIEPVEATLADQHVVPVSSTMIRWLLAHGRVSDAAALLGRPYEMVAPVVRGDQRGRTLGYPTANLDHGDQLLPADGIYAGEAALPDGARWPAAISVGVKPTFGGRERVCEAHLIGYDGPPDQYGWIISLQFQRWLRDQLTFTEVKPLIEQLHRDVRQAALHD